MHTYMHTYTNKKGMFEAYIYTHITMTQSKGTRKREPQRTSVLSPQHRSLSLSQTNAPQLYACKHEYI